MLGGHHEISFGSCLATRSTLRSSWPANLEGGMVIATLCRNLLEYPRATAALHLNSPRRKSLDAVASLLIAARLIITSAASPLAEQTILDP